MSAVETKSCITYSQFTKSELRVGRIKEVYPLPEAPPNTFYLVINLGEYGLKRSLVNLRGYYNSEDLESRLVVVLANTPPRIKGNLTSDVEVIKTTTADERDVLVRPDWEVVPGSRVM